MKYKLNLGIYTKNTEKAGKIALGESAFQKRNRMIMT